MHVVCVQRFWPFLYYILLSQCHCNHMMRAEEALHGDALSNPGLHSTSLINLKGHFSATNFLVTECEVMGMLKFPHRCYQKNISLCDLIIQ